MSEAKREMTFDEMSPGVLEETEQWITSVNDGRLPSMEATFSLVAALRTCVKRAQNEIFALRAQEQNEPLTEAQKVRKGFIDLVDAERSAQDAKWGYPNYNTFCEWGSYLAEECGEAIRELNDLQMGVGSKERLVKELVQTAAMCLSILQQFDSAQETTRARYAAVNHQFIADVHEPKHAPDERSEGK
jgi:NTP pyrophosphatase (non-canonical NTP hydrolase)